MFKHKRKPIELDGFVLVSFDGAGQANITGIVSAVEASQLYDRLYNLGASYVEVVPVKMEIDSHQMIERVLKSKLEATAHFAVKG